MLALPDRDALLQLFDHVARRFECAAAMGMADRDRDAAVADLQRAETVLHRDVATVRESRGFLDDRRELALRHRPIRRVLDPGNVSPLVHVANHAEEEHGSSVRASTHAIENRGYIDRL